MVVLAQEEARTLKHNYIGSEHILLGLLREQEGLAARALESLEITAERVREQVTRIVGAGEEPMVGQIPFTPRAKKILELALREAMNLGHNYIGTEHILLAVVQENEGVAARILLDFNASPATVRNEILQMLSGPRSRPHGATTSGRAVIDEAWLNGLGALLDRLGLEIRAKLGREPDSGDLLLALTCLPESLPAQTMTELGIDPDVLWGSIERAREQTLRAREQAASDRDQLAQQIRDVRAAKEQAIEASEFQRAAALRDQERELVEHTPIRPLMQSETLREITRRLGIPDTDAPPHP